MLQSQKAHILGRRSFLQTVEAPDKATDNGLDRRPVSEFVSDGRVDCEPLDRQFGQGDVIR